MQIPEIDNPRKTVRLIFLSINPRLEEPILASKNCKYLPDGSRARWVCENAGDSWEVCIKGPDWFCGRGCEPVWVCG